ncbi:hypothetical protein [Tritonibacter sp. SIMBA_163]|uniref:hypothetical protein n=1 Tax=Tritonibacter sp. SIMBA_163 TaxID=3080868 RepID=UPI003980F17C
MCNFENHPRFKILDLLGSDLASSSLFEAGTSRDIAVPYARVCDDKERLGTAYRWNNGETSVVWNS